MKKLNVNIYGRFLPMATACGRYNLSRNTLSKVAEESGAVIRIGRSVRIDTKKLDSYFEGLAEA